MNRKNIKRFLFWIRLKHIYDLLPKKLKHLSVLFVVLILITSIIDLLGLALFIPLLLLLLEDDYIQKHERIKSFYEFTELNNEINFTIFLLLIVFFLIVLKNILSIILTRKQTLYALTIQTDISALVLKNYFKRDILSLKKQNSNQIVWEINSLPSQFTRSLLLPLGTFLNELLVAIIIGIGLFIYDPRIIFLLSVSVIPITFLFYRFTKRKVQAFQQRQALLTPMLNALAQQAIFGIVDVILTNTKKTYSKNYQKLLDESKVLSTNILTYMSIPAKIIEVAIISAITLLIIAGLYTGVDKKETLTFLGVFALAAYRLIPSFNKITVSVLSFKSYQYTLNFLSRSLRKIDLNSINKSLQQKQLIFNQSIKLKNISFEYKKGQPVLNKLNLEINKGEKIGIIGKSGSGKTTLINILLGLLKDYKGEILIDGVTLEENTLLSWYHKVGYVQQNIFLLDGTIRENIAFGIDGEKINDSKINECVIAANLQELIKTLPLGLDTKVGELGNLISGGQKQRIGIARALYSDAEILFFDEATSALDKETESQITDTLKHLSIANNKLTMIVIAHRYSTLEHCDRIIDLKDGVIDSIKNYKDIS